MEERVNKKRDEKMKQNPLLFQIIINFTMDTMSFWWKLFWLLQISANTSNPIHMHTILVLLFMHFYDKNAKLLFNSCSRPERQTNIINTDWITVVVAGFAVISHNNKKPIFNHVRQLIKVSLHLYEIMSMILWRPPYNSITQRTEGKKVVSACTNTLKANELHSFSHCVHFLLLLLLLACSKVLCMRQYPFIR